MNGLLAYSGITTKIKAMASSRITIQDYEYLSNLYTVTDFFAFLKDHKGYKDIFSLVEDENIHRGQIETYFDNALYNDFAKIYRFSNMEQRKFLDLIFLRYEIDILKNCLQLSFSDAHHYDPPIINDFILKHLTIPVQKLTEVRSLDEFIQLLNGTKYYKLFSRLLDSNNTTSFDFELQLDHYYYKRAWKLKDSLSSIDKKVFTDSLGSEIDLENLLWLYRQRSFYDFSSADIFANLIPVTYKLNHKLLKQIGESSTNEEFKRLIEGTVYKGFLDSDSLSLETLMFNRLSKIKEHNSLKYPNSMAPVLFYMNNKSREINRLTTALEGIRYKLDSSEIMKYVLEG